VGAQDRALYVFDSGHRKQPGGLQLRTVARRHYCDGGLLVVDPTP